MGKKSGTSISAALVTSAAASVRQYFQQGYYPSGEESGDGQFREDLWGSTVKAILIAGSTPLVDQQKGGQLGTNEGYGSLILNRVLPFEDDDQIDLFVAQETISMGSTWEHSVEVASNEEPLVVTVVWTDPPAALGAFDPVVNKLELSMLEEAHQRQFSADVDNAQNGNVKRFYVPSPTEGKYSISVKPSFVVDEQSFSVVITGRFSDRDRSSPLCCSGATLEGIGGCITVDTIICIVFV